MEDSGVVVARKLTLLSGGAKGAVYPLVEPKVGLGRDAQNAIRLEGAFISRHHAVLERTNGEYILRDLHSCNGTFLNGQPVQDAHLKPGDRLRLGEIEMSYEAANEPTVTALPVASLPAPTEEFADLRRQLAAVEQQLTAAVQQASARTAELDLARGVFAAAGEQSALQLEKLVQQNDALAADLVAARKQAEELRATAVRAMEESVRVRAQSEITANEQQQHITRLTANTERLAAELCAGNEALKTARTELETVADVRRQSQDLAKRGEELMAQLTAEKERVEALRQSGNRQSAALQNATAKQAELATEVKRLQAQLDHAQQSAGKAEEEKQLLTSELGAVRGQLTVLQRESQDGLAAAQQRAAEQLLNLQVELDQARHASSRVSELTSQNAQLTSQNSELLAQIAALQLRETKVNSLEEEVATLRDALKRVNDELVEARTTAKLEAMNKRLDRLAQSSGTAGTTELAGLQAELAKACVDWAELRQLPPVVDRLTRQNEGLRIAVAKAQEEAMLAKRCLSDQTTEAFAQIRRGMLTEHRGNGGSRIGGKDGGLLHQLDAVRRAFGILPKR
jgi:chromosome segregation ATPase